MQIGHNGVELILDAIKTLGRTSFGQLDVQQIEYDEVTVAQRFEGETYKLQVSDTQDAVHY